MLWLRLRGAARALARDPALRSALFAFTLTRGLVFALFVLCGQITIFRPDPDVEFYDARISVRHVAFARVVRHAVDVADCKWYVGVARDGYERRPYSGTELHNWAFFPAYPLAVRAVSRLTGDPALTGVALSNLFFFAALVLLYRASRTFGFEPGDASRTVFYVAAYPFSYFFSVPMTESLFLMLTVGSFYAARRERWLAAGLLGGAASATRVTGVLLLPALAVLYWETYRSLRPRPNFLPLLLVPSGLMAYMYFLNGITGNAFAFKDIVVEAWRREPQFFLVTLLKYFTDPLLIAEPWNLRLLNFLTPALALAAGVVLLKWRRWSLACYTLAATVFALSNKLLVSQARYAMVLFPAFMVLAVAGRSQRLDHAVRTAMLILLVLLTVLFAKHFDFAAA